MQTEKCWIHQSEQTILPTASEKRGRIWVQLQQVSECLQLCSQTPSTLHGSTEIHTSPSLSRKLYTSKRNLSAAAKHQKSDSIFSVWARAHVSTITLKVEVLQNWSTFTYLKNQFCFDWTSKLWTIIELPVCGADAFPPSMRKPKKVVLENNQIKQLLSSCKQE